MISRNREHQRIEMASFVKLLQSEDVRSYLEIGSRDGTSFDTVMRALPTGSHGLAVDLPGAAWGMDGSKRALLEVVARLNNDGYRCEAVFGASQSPDVISLVSRHAPYDAIFIDADHRYGAVAADWNNYRAIGRIVAFHDIAGSGVVNQRGLPVEVPRLWHEIRTRHRHQEIIAPTSRLGIGVVYAGVDL